MNDIEKYTNPYTKDKSYIINPQQEPFHNNKNKEQLKEILRNTIKKLQNQTITQQDKESTKKIKQEINNSINQIKILSTIVKESREIDNEDYNSILKMIENYYSQYLVLTKTLNPPKQQVKSIKNLQITKSDNDVKNILIFLKDKKTSTFCIEKDLEGNGKKDLQTTFEKALKSNIKLLTTDAFEDIRSTRKIKKIKNNSLPNNRDENYPWEVRRRDSTRMSIMFLRTCPENLEKLKKFYNLPHLESVILIGGIIKVGDEYNKLAPLTKQIEDNRDYINYLNELFSNPTTDISILNKIISETETIYETLNYSPKQK